MRIFDRYLTIKKILKKKKLTIFDIGANNGQTIIEISKNFPNSTVHSFEPLEECQNALNNLKNKVKNLKIIINQIAVGSIPQKKIFYKNQSTNLSSFLKVNLRSKFLIKMKKLKKQKKYLKSINIPVKVNQIKLDTYINQHKVKQIDLIKIDTQGYEEDVLKGISGKNLRKIKIIVIELNFWDLYEKNNSFYIIEKYLKNDFLFWDISAIFKNPKYFNTDHLDAIYINKEYINRIK